MRQSPTAHERLAVAIDVYCSKVFTNLTLEQLVGLKCLAIRDHEILDWPTAFATIADADKVDFLDVYGVAERMGKDPAHRQILAVIRRGAQVILKVNEEPSARVS